MDENRNGWPEWGKHVLKELERLNDCYDNQMKQMQVIQIDIAMLKVKSALLGAVAGLVPAIGALIYTIVKNK